LRARPGAEERAALAAFAGRRRNFLGRAFLDPALWSFARGAFFVFPPFLPPADLFAIPALYIDAGSQRETSPHPPRITIP